MDERNISNYRERSQLPIKFQGDLFYYEDVLNIINI